MTIRSVALIGILSACGDGVPPGRLASCSITAVHWEDERLPSVTIQVVASGCPVGVGPWTVDWRANVDDGSRQGGGYAICRGEVLLSTSYPGTWSSTDGWLTDDAEVRHRCSIEETHEP